MESSATAAAATSRLYRVRKTCLKMLAKRGYIVDEAEIAMTTEEFRIKFGDQPSRDSMTILVEKADDASDQLFVFFPTDEKVGVKPLKTYCMRMKDENVLRAIIVVKGNLTPFAKQAVKEMSAHGFKMEYFRDAELLVDITEHRLVPEHSVLTPQEKQELLERYRLKPSQLPRIQVTDPIARYFGLKLQQVVKIIMSPHGGGMVGSMHSHDPEYPDDAWNLYAMLDRDTTTALNVTNPAQALGTFKPFVHRLTDEPNIVSEADPEIIVLARFTSPVHIRKIMVVGGGIPAMHPSRLLCYVNHEAIDFTNIEDIRAAQEFDLPINEEGTVELITSLHRFTNVTTIAFYFPGNYDAATTVIKYIGLQGDHTHYRREAVDTVYEVLCNGQDISTPDEGHRQANENSHMH